MCFMKEVRTGWASYLLPDLKSSLAPGFFFGAIGTQTSHCSLHEHEQNSGHEFLSGLPTIPSQDLYFTCLTPLLWVPLPPQLYLERAPSSGTLRGLPESSGSALASPSQVFSLTLTSANTALLPLGQSRRRQAQPHRGVNSQMSVAHKKTVLGLVFTILVCFYPSGR